MQAATTLTPPKEEVAKDSSASKPVLPETKEGYLNSAMMGKQGICSSSEGVRLKNANVGQSVDYITGPRLKQWA